MKYWILLLTALALFTLLHCEEHVKKDLLTLDLDEKRELAKKDKEPPTIEIQAPKDQEIFYKPFLKIKATVTDDTYPHVVIMQLDDTEPRIIPRDAQRNTYEKVSYKFANLTSGKHTLTLSVIDPADNVASQTVHFTIDTEAAMTFTRIWGPYIYLYGVGGIFFIIGMIIIIRSKSLNLKLKYYRRWFYILLFGLAWYMLIHGSITVAAIWA
jgi:hypothetical protein